RASGHSGAAPATISETRDGNTPLKAAAVQGTGRRRPGEPSRSRVRRPATEQTGCGAEGVAAAASPDSLHATPSQPAFRVQLPTTLGVRACTPETMHMQLRKTILAASLAVSLALPAAAAAQSTDLDNVLVTATRTA